MKLIRKYGFEILLGILGVAFFTGTLYIVLVMPEDLMVRGTIMFGLFFDAIAIYYVLRRLWRTKWSRRVVPAVQKLFEKLAQVLKIVRQKLGIKEREPQTVLKGRSIIFFDTKPITEQAKRKKKPSAWKNLQTDKEKLGDALFAEGLINDPTFFDTLNGIKADWDKDQAYWAFCTGEEYMMIGVNDQTISTGDSYRFVYTK